MITPIYRSAFLLQTSYVALCVLWNGIGLWQRSQGEASIGPAASWSAIVVLCLSLLGLYLCLHKSWQQLYLLGSIFLAFLASLAIHGAFTKNPTLWPSEFWRYAGAGVNGFGLIGFVFAVLAATRQGLSYQGLRGK